MASDLKTKESGSSSEPSIRATAFHCPHCGAFTTQFWFELRSTGLGDNKFPYIPSEQHIRKLAETRPTDPEKREVLDDLLKLAKRMQDGLVFFERTSAGGSYSDTLVRNLHLSRCYNCTEIAVWVHDRLLFPAAKTGVAPNPDLPADVLHDFDEAREIVNPSPRGAAALLRLCVQKLCKALGEKGKKIDDDIAELVKKGLNPLVQQALDIVRVIGNEAVHPGELDLRDDRDTALELFGLVNEIAEQMITRPKAVAALYAKLPEEKRKAIEKRDKKP